jgi:hypothetical protein
VPKDIGANLHDLIMRDNIVAIPALALIEAAKA